MLQNAGRDRKGKQAGAQGRAFWGTRTTKRFLSQEQGAEERRQFEQKQKSNLEGKGSSGEQAKGVHF